MSEKKLCKSRKNKMIGGVCGGLADYLNMDPTLVRIIAVILCLIKGVGFFVYLIACIVMPYDEEFSDEDMENLKSANINPEEEKKGSSKKSAESKDEKLHSDDAFDSYFKKN